MEWGEYRLGDLFEIEGTKSLDSNAIEFTKTGINFIGRTFDNNGIQGKIKKRTFEPNLPQTITATVIGNYKYAKFQRERYYCSQNINKLTPKPILKKWNKKTAYFFVSSVQKFISLYDGQQGGYKLTDIKNHIISTPTKNGEIDFAFMEEFIAELEAERIAELEAYLQATGLKDYTLTEQEQQVLADFEAGKFTWGEFKVVDVFDVKNTGNILSRDIIKNSGRIPYLCAGVENNSISSYISHDKKYLDKGNCVFIGGKTFVVSYQKEDFFSNDSHNLILSLKDDIAKTKKIHLGLVSCINKSLSHLYSWGNSISNKKIQKDVVTLPTKNNQPDYALMETLISAIQKQVIKDVVLYADRKIAATKKVVH